MTQKILDGENDNNEVSISPPEPFQTDAVLTITGAHFIHDTFSAFVSPLLPLLQKTLSTNYAATGSLVIYTQLPSLLNPFVGYLADRISLRYFIILAPAITATLMSMMGLVSTYWGLAMLLFMAGISIAAFHAPAPAMIGRVSGRYVGRGMSFFMAGGELGRTLGPIMVASTVEIFGLGGIWRLAIIGWLTSLLLYFRLRNVAAQPARTTNLSFSSFWQENQKFFYIIAIVQFARVFLIVPVTTYLPLFMTNVVGANPVLAAAALSILEGAGVVGALSAGTISDKFGRGRVLVTLFVISPALLILFLVAPLWLAVPLLVALGFIGISPTAVLLALVQDKFPTNRALANGIFLGLNFVARAFATWVVGALADGIGLGQAFLWSAIMAWVAVPAIYLITKN